MRAVHHGHHFDWCAVAGRRTRMGDMHLAIGDNRERRCSGELGERIGYPLSQAERLGSQVTSWQRASRAGLFVVASSQSRQYCLWYWLRGLGAAIRREIRGRFAWNHVYPERRALCAPAGVPSMPAAQKTCSKRAVPRSHSTPSITFPRGVRRSNAVYISKGSSVVPKQ